MTKKSRQLAFLFKFLSVLPLVVLFAGPARADIPAGWPWKITNLIYPTLGCPAIIKKGETFQLEFDFAGKGEGTVQPAVTDWEANLFSSNDRWPTETECVVVEAVTDGLSERWPAWSPSTDYWKGSGPWAGKEVWKVTVRVPAGTRTDLYDLMVTATGRSRGYMAGTEPVLRPESTMNNQQLLEPVQEPAGRFSALKRSLGGPGGAPVFTSETAATSRSRPASAAASSMTRLSSGRRRGCGRSEM